MNHPTVLVTGASSGIGLELARVFAAHGYSLVLLARQQAVLEQLAREFQQHYKVPVWVLPADLRQADAPVQIAESLKQQHITVDVLVNNAGFGIHGPCSQNPVQQQLDLLQVNMTALVHLTRLLLPGMLERRCGGVLNVASTAAFQAGPDMALYYASKAFVLSFSEALHEELRPAGLHVSCLCPGPTATGFAAAADLGDARLFRFGTQSAAAVAQFGYAAYQRNQAIAIPGLRNRLLALGARLSPRFVSRKIAKALNR